jgi:hypothetical protein
MQSELDALRKLLFIVLKRQLAIEATMAQDEGLAAVFTTACEYYDDPANLQEIFSEGSFLQLLKDCRITLSDDEQSLE